MRYTTSVIAASAVAAAATLAALCAFAASAADTGNKGLDFAGIDRSVAPGDDFFRYANGLSLIHI